MKKSVWITIITMITVCCVIGGTVYHVGRYGFGFWSRGGLTDNSSDLESFDVINVDANLMDVTITAGDKFYLSCQYSDGLEPVYEVENGTLSVKQKQKLYKNWGINDRHCRLMLTIPAQTAMDKIDVQTAMGEIRLEGISASECEVQSNMGNCTLKKCSFNETDVSTNMGEVSVSDTSLGKAEANSDMGTIRVNTCTFDNLKITASMGDARVDAAQDLGGYDMDLGTEFGSVKVNGQDEGTKYHQSGDAGDLEINTSMGSIRLDYGKKE